MSVRGSSGCGKRSATADGERDFKEGEPVLREGNEVKYGFIRDHAGNYLVNRLCRLLGVRRSAYYDWRDQPGRVIAPAELALRRRLKELLAASRGSLGSRTMMKNLNQEGFEIGHDRTRRLMKALNLKVKAKRKYKVTTDSKQPLAVAQNVLNQEFSPQAPNHAWGVNTTICGPSRAGFTWRGSSDLYSRRGWAGQWMGA